MTYRQLKQQVFNLLQAEDFNTGLQALGELPPRKVVNPLFGLLHHHSPVRWRAVAAMGKVVAAMADQDLESARVIMRRLMWNLNDESGGMGWGSPEAMGEIMARHRRLGEEYATILISYLNPGGNYLEHEGLQQGLLWAVGRLAGAHPDLAAPALDFLLPFLTSPDPTLRGLSVWCAGLLPAQGNEIRRQLSVSRGDRAVVELYLDGRMEKVTIADLARAVL